MVVLLLAFFVLLNSMATVDNRKIRMALGSLRGVFGFMQGGMGALTGGGGPPRSAGVRVWTFGRRFNLSEGEAADALKWFDLLVEKAGQGERVDVGVNREGTRISLEGEVLFESGTSGLTLQGREILEGIEKIIEVTEAPVRIEGHTDNVPIHTETFPSNCGEGGQCAPLFHRGKGYPRRATFSGGLCRYPSKGSERYS
jgi:chemotaxis protein MotB